MESPRYDQGMAASNRGYIQSIYSLELEPFPPEFLPHLKNSSLPNDTLSLLTYTLFCLEELEINFEERLWRLVANSNRENENFCANVFYYTGRSACATLRLEFRNNGSGNCELKKKTRLLAMQRYPLKRSEDSEEFHSVIIAPTRIRYRASASVPLLLFVNTVIDQGDEKLLYLQVWLKFPSSSVIYDGKLLLKGEKNQRRR